MRLRQWLATALSVGFLLASAAFAVAQDAPAGEQPTSASEALHLPQPCVDAGVTTKAECEALLAKENAAAAKAAAGQAAADQKAEAKAAADQAAADQKAQAKAAADQAAADQKAQAKAAADQAAADQKAEAKAAADQAAADQKAQAKAAADQAAADQKAQAKAAADQAAADEKAQAKAAADQAAADQKVQAKAAADQAAADQKAQAKAAADQAAADQKAQAKAAADQAAADQKAEAKAAADQAAADQKAQAKAAADQAAADKAAADQGVDDKASAAKAAADQAAPAEQPNKKAQRIMLSKDCVDANLTTQEECDASHAIAGQKAKTEPATAAPSGYLPTEVTPAKSATDKPAEQSAAPALPDITSGLNAAAKSYNRGVAALDKAGSDNAAANKARAKIKTAQIEIDALCKSNKFESTGQCLAQYAVQLTPIPVAAGGEPTPNAPVQPVEVIRSLPKGVTQQDVAPLLDSAKDQKAGLAQTVAPASLSQDQTTTSAALPQNDKAAQASLKRQKVTPIDEQKGQQIDANTVAQIEVPQNVTIINQTVVNNTTNTTISNTQNNNGQDAQLSVDQGSQQGQQDNASRLANNPIGLGLSIVLQVNNQLIINSPARDQRRIAFNDQDRTTYERLPHERYRETITRRDGVTIVTIYNRNGDILQRSRFDQDGHEIVLAYFDDSHERDLLEWRDPGEDLPPLRLRIPARDYVLDAEEADQSRVQLFFAQPPVEQVDRLYSINEVKRSSRLRDMVRRLEIGNLSFDTGAATVSQDQVANLSKVAGAMLKLLERNPAETFLIEGHTDAVGSDIYNLRLSDARAATVAQILTDFYHVPPENLATQGYGKRYLKVNTDLAERLNRRVTVRRITTLVTVSKY